MKKSCYTVLYFLILPLFANAQAVVELGEQESYTLKGNFLSIYKDETGKLLFEEAKAKSKDWEHASENGVNQGYTTDAVWVHFKLKNRTEHTNWILDLEYSLLDTLGLYIQEGNDSIQQFSTGRSLPFASRGPLLQPGFAFPLDLHPEKVYDVWLRARTTGPLILPLKVMHQRAYVKNQLAWHVFYGIYFGALMVMIFYNLFIFVVLRDLNYLYYVLTIICTVSIFATVAGYSYMYVFPNAPWVNSYFTKVFMGFVVITTAIFARNFLNSRKFVPWADYTLLGMIGLAIIAQILVITDLKPSATNSVVSLHTVILLVTGIICWRKGNKYARFYVLAWSLYIIGGLLISFRNSGFLPLNFWTTHGAEIGSAIEVILLSLALSDRYRTIRKEKEALTKETLRMQKKHSEELEGKVQERTLQLSEANEELNQVNEELNTTIETVQVQKSEIEAQRDGLAKQQQALEKAYSDIRSSISYAKRIQNAKLPAITQIHQAFQDAFVLFRPKDQVSGDFYWFAKVDDKKLVAAVDCTGHGVPGAFMSMIGSDLLNEIVLQRRITEPGKILQLLHEGIRKTLRQQETENRDGMDLAICAIDETEKVLYYAGAKNPLLYITNNQLEQIKGDRISIGGVQRNHKRSFTTHKVILSQSTAFYIFSDGYQDQFGGPEGRKFMIKRLKALLLENAHLPLVRQQYLLEKELGQWQKWPGRKQEKQVDDILMIGFQIG